MSTDPTFLSTGTGSMDPSRDSTGTSTSEVGGGEVIVEAHTFPELQEPIQEQIDDGKDSIPMPESLLPPGSPATYSLNFSPERTPTASAQRSASGQLVEAQLHSSAPNTVVPSASASHQPTSTKSLFDCETKFEGTAVIPSTPEPNGETAQTRPTTEEEASSAVVEDHISTNDHVEKGEVNSAACEVQESTLAETDASATEEISSPRSAQRRGRRKTKRSAKAPGMFSMSSTSTCSSSVPFGVSNFWVNL